MKYHVVVTGSRPDSHLVEGKKRFLPMPTENIDTIHQMLGRVQSSDYVRLYHGDAAGVDRVCEDWAFNSGVRPKSFPAYWATDSGDPRSSDKAAGVKRNLAMLRAAKQAAYGKDDEAVVLLAFFNTPELSQSRGTSHCVDTAKRLGIQVHEIALPVKKASVPDASGQIELTPFTQPKF